MAVKLATNFGANVVSNNAYIQGYFNDSAGGGRPAALMKPLGIQSGLERDGGDSSCEWVTLGTPGGKMIRDFNTLDGFTISEGHFQIRVHIPTLNMGAVAGLTYEFITLLDTAGAQLVSLKLLRSFTGGIAVLRVDGGGG